MKIKNWLTCVQDRAKGKDVVEKAKSSIKGGSAEEEEEEEEEEEGEEEMYAPHAVSTEHMQRAHDSTKKSLALGFEKISG